MAQLAQLFRRGIVTPLTVEASNELAEWSLTQPARVELITIPDQAIFEEIWQTGVFQAINERCSCLIDDFEEECLRPEAVNEALEVLADKYGKAQSPGVDAFIANLTALLKGAKDRQQCVYFVF